MRSSLFAIIKRRNSTFEKQCVSFLCTWTMFSMEKSLLDGENLLSLLLFGNWWWILNAPLPRRCANHFDIVSLQYSEIEKTYTGIYKRPIFATIKFPSWYCLDESQLFDDCAALKFFYTYISVRKTRLVYHICSKIRIC